MPRHYVNFESPQFHVRRLNPDLEETRLSSFANGFLRHVREAGHDGWSFTNTGEGVMSVSAVFEADTPVAAILDAQRVFTAAVDAAGGPAAAGSEKPSAEAFMAPFTCAVKTLSDDPI